MLTELFKEDEKLKSEHEQQQHKIRARLDERGTFIEHTFLPFHLFLFDQYKKDFLWLPLDMPIESYVNTWILRHKEMISYPKEKYPNGN